MDNETNLLFGAVALSMDFIDTNQLSESWAKYVSNDDVSLSTILLEMEWITSNQATEISERVDQTVNEHGSADSAIRSFADFGIHTSMGGFRDEDVQRRLTVMLLSATQMGEKTIGHPKRSEDESNQGLVQTIDLPHAHPTRYTLTRVHGEGGLGRVWLARDRDLNREVALKELRHEADSESEARFFREAQITGQLEHPNIIPIYEVTRREEDNQLFYTMKFMRGQTLNERIHAHFKKRRGNDSDRVEFLEMLSSFVGICNAIGYAHSRGILHRDLKPQNVMMGAFGEVILLDWGLAKFIDENATQDPVQVHESYAPKSTEQGQVLGTPAYMAPEQADGRADLVDERTDIYGLGGILFAIVSGHAPHRPSGRGSVLRKTQNLLKQISAGPTPSLSAVDSSVPPALVAICMKAMAKERSDRYGSASELANDVQRWLADEPISVYREPWRERVARWTRRNKTWTQAGGAALLIVAFVSTISTFVVNSARQEVEVALGKEQNAVKVANLALGAEEVAKAEAMRRFLESQKHVDEFFERFSTGLQYWPGAEEIHTRLLEKAAANYQRFAEQKSDDPALIATAATASLRYGDMQLMLGNSKKATAAYQSAESTFLNLSKKHPTVLDYQLQLVSSRNRLGELFSTHGSYEDAIRSFDTALDGLNALSKEHSDLAKYKLAKAGVLRNRALFFQQVDKLKESESALLESVSLFSELSKKDDLPEYNEGLAQTRNNLGALLLRIGRPEDAVVAHRQAIEGYEALANVPSIEHLRYLERLAATRMNLGNALQPLGKDSEIETAYLESIEDYIDLLNILPGLPLYREGWALSHTNLAQRLYNQGRNKGALQSSEAALTEFINLLNLNSQVARYHEEKATCMLTYGLILRDSEDVANAAQAFGGARLEFLDLVEKFRTNPVYGRRLATTLLHLARLHQMQSQTTEAQTYYDNAIARYKTVITNNATDLIAQDSLAWTYTRKAELLSQLGMSELASQSYREAFVLREKLLDNAEHIVNMAWFLAHCQDDKYRDVERAVKLAEQAKKLAPDNGRHWHMLGVTNYRAGHWDASVKALQLAIDFRTSKNGLDYFYLAMAQWQQKEKVKAKASFDDAIEIMMTSRPGNPRLIKLRSEAAKLLQLTEPQPGKSQD